MPTEEATLNNQEAILKNQSKIIDNQEAILKNQNEIKDNQETIVENQSTIVTNQKQIVDNQVLLSAISKTQAYILNAVRKAAGQNESQQETEKFLDQLKSGEGEVKTDLSETESI